MAIYAVGDVQGCLLPLQRLLERIRFDPAEDRLWFVGDLVNRGPESLAVLRFVQRLGDRAVVVLGNHELHLLAVGLGAVPARKKDTFDDVLTAPDRDVLLTWLRHRPLLHRESRTLLLHAGLLPQWTADQAERLAREIDSSLRGQEAVPFLRALYDDTPLPSWSDDLPGYGRLCVAAKALTRLRVCSNIGEMALGFTGPPQDAPSGFMPWFRVPERRSSDVTIVCGHWASLGLHLASSVMVLDSGCVYGRTLTAIRLDDRAVFQVPGHA
jgi:bis(5'-nucleosyl)-tetraphosphatase (symmetrical)